MWYHWPPLAVQPQEGLVVLHRLLPPPLLHHLRHRLPPKQNSACTSLARGLIECGCVAGKEPDVLCCWLPTGQELGYRWIRLCLNCIACSGLWSGGRL